MVDNRGVVINGWVIFQLPQFVLVQMRIDGRLS